MGFKESNPIQQRMELLAEKWEKTIIQPGVNVIRIHAQDNENQMVNAFYTYLLGVDTKSKDIIILFESSFGNGNDYAVSLVKELEKLIDVWNHAKKDDITIRTEDIQWRPDFSLKKANNPAYLFIENINRFATYLNLATGIYVVPALMLPFAEVSEINKWLDHAIKAGLHPKVKLSVNDTESSPVFEFIAKKYPDTVITLLPQLDMDSAMQQIAAMGNPNDPGVAYRQAFVKLTQAIGKRKEDEAEKYAGKCIEIALKNIKVNPYWIGQIIVVYAALANDQIGYKNYKKAIAYATLGVEASQKSKEIIADEFIHRKFIAQAVMLRGSLYTVEKEWEKAIAEFETAAINYAQANDCILAIEAYRMAGYSYINYGDSNSASKTLAKALALSENIPAHVIKYTAFAGVLELLLQLNDTKFCSYKDVAHYGEKIYGNNWLTEIANWKNPHTKKIADSIKVQT